MKVSWRLKRVEVVQRRTVLYSHEEKNTRVWSAKESLPKVKIEQEGEGSCGSAKKKFAEGSKEVVCLLLAVGSTGVPMTRALEHHGQRMRG